MHIYTSVYLLCSSSYHMDWIGEYDLIHQPSQNNKYKHTYVYIRLYVHKYIHIWICIYAYVYISIYLHYLSSYHMDWIRSNPSIFVCICIYTHIWTYICIYIHVYIYSYIRINMYICIYTYPYTCIVCLHKRWIEYDNTSIKPELKKTYICIYMHIYT
jgi:hypothetical protein